MTVLFAFWAGSGHWGSHVVVLFAAAAYLALAARLIRGAANSARMGLAGIYVIATVIGAAALQIGVRSDNAFFRYIPLGTAIAVLAGVLLSRAMPGVSSGRVLRVSLAGALMLPVLLLVLILRAFVVGTG